MMMHNIKMLDWRESDLFLGVSRESRDLVSDSMTRMYQPGEILCAQGSAADHLYLLVDGRVDVLRDGEVLISRGRGEVIGEQAFIENGLRGATVRAAEFLQVLRIPHRIVELLLKDPAFARNLLRILSTKLTEATRQRGVRYRNERILFGEFRSKVSDQVLQELLRDPRSAARPRNVDAVVLFSDIRGFTEASMSMSPEEVAADLTTYFDAIVGIVHKHAGMVDKFVGDAVMAVWGGFDDTPTATHVTSAFDCAQEMIETARSLRFGSHPIDIGVGLNVGRVFMGNVGGEGKSQFTVLGSPVNVASRLEGKCKELGFPLIVGPAFADLLGAAAGYGERRTIDIRGVGPTTVVGFSTTAAFSE